MRRRSARMLVCLLGLSLLGWLSARPAICGGPDQVTKYKRRAYAAFEIGRYALAIRYFQRAYELRRDTRLLYSIALAYLRSYEVDKADSSRVHAQRLFKRFLQLTASLKRDTKLRRARAYAKKYLASPTLKQPATGPASPSTGPAGVGPAPPHVRSPASRPHRPARPLVKTAPAPAEKAAAARAATKNPAERDVANDRLGAHWLLYGAGAIALIAGAITGGLSLASSGEANRAADAGDRANNLRAADRADALALATDVIIASGVIAAAVGLVVHLLGRRRRAAHLSWSPGNVGLALRY